MHIRNWPVSRKLASLITTLLVILALIEFNSLFRLYDELLIAKKDQVKEQVESAHSLVQHYYQQRADLGETEAKAQAMTAIASLRYAKNGYFWINDLEHKLIMHPIKEQLNGKDMTNAQDASGKYHWREMVKTVKQQSEGFVEYTYQGPQFDAPKDKASYVKGFKPWGWVIGSGIYLSDIAEIFEAILMESVIFMLLLLSGAIAGSWFMVRDITQPLQRILGSVRAITSGDLTQHLELQRSDEMGQLAKEVDLMATSLKEILSEVARASQELKHSAQEMGDNTSQTSMGVDRQFHEVNQLAAAVEQMSCTIQEVASNAVNTAGATQEATSHANSSQEDVGYTVDQIGQLASGVSAASGLMQQLNEQTSQIGNVVSVIREISEQTNLLALNAAIEAARAGEAGRGFAVVADEVRNLASRTQTSTGEIEAIIEQLQAQAQNANRTMHESEKQAEQNAELVEQTGSKIGLIVEHINTVNDMSNQIASAAEEQSAVASEISASLTGIRDISQDVLDRAQINTQNSNRVNQMADGLSTQLSRFRLN